MQEWLADHAVTIAIASGLMFVVGIVSLPILIGRIRADYFAEPDPPESDWRHRHPVIRLSALIFKNLLGVVLLLAGIAMLIGPGQGLITVLIGIMLLDFPGKRRFEFWIIRRRGVLKAVNWIRRKSHKPPLEVYEEKPAE